MPSTKKRLALTLNDHEYEVLKTIAQAQGSSMAAVVHELLVISTPRLEELADLISTAERVRSEMIEDHKRASERARVYGQTMTEAIYGQGSFDHLEDVEHGPEYRRRMREVLGAPAVADEEAAEEHGPPTCNTGVRSVNPTQSGSVKRAA